MTRKPTARKYIVRLSDDERKRLNELITTGKHPARRLLRVRILLKADISEAGDGWPDSPIAEALDTSTDTILRTRQRFVEQGLDAALTHKYSLASARPRIFDGAAEAKLIALACGVWRAAQGSTPGLSHLTEDGASEHV
ncbi:MAG TPA: helix-turn-helix domain-containing protein, partial [Rhodopila sp.]|nr:helix-turn-helix domain-containing protein [Rhodopila sp.]